MGNIAQGKIKILPNIDKKTFDALQLLKAIKRKSAGEIIDEAIALYVKENQEMIQREMSDFTKILMKD